jgi:rRNA small subunit pseudouridine methyltransferase Nep1
LSLTTTVSGRERKMEAFPQAEEAPTKKLIVVLVMSMLETTKMRKTGEFHLLNSDDHGKLLSKLGKEVSMYRPDITHHCLLNLLDSPLNKAGMLQVYIHTHENVLIEINPSVRIPRTYKRFAGLMTHLLHMRKIKGQDTNQILMKVIKNPVTKHLPAGAYKVGTSVTSDLTDVH